MINPCQASSAATALDVGSQLLLPTLEPYQKVLDAAAQVLAAALASHRKCASPSVSAPGGGRSQPRDACTLPGLAGGVASNVLRAMVASTFISIPTIPPMACSQYRSRQALIRGAVRLNSGGEQLRYCRQRLS